MNLNFIVMLKELLLKQIQNRFFLMVLSKKSKTCETESFYKGILPQTEKGPETKIYLKDNIKLCFVDI